MAPVHGQDIDACGPLSEAQALLHHFVSSTVYVTHAYTVVL